jgi:hypothetical protein
MPNRRISASHTSVSDFDPKCDCGNHAAAYLEIHAIDYCTQDRPTWAKFLCQACLTRDMSRVQNIVVEGGAFCSTCGLTIVSLSDMVVRLCPLWAIGEG